MEYAEQNLAQFLANRPLTEGEILELLPPTLDALAFLHSRNLVHGQLKPSNVLVVADELKLASDTVRPAGEAATSISMSSVYDPPEARDGSFSTAGDIWALGVTLYEALTQTTPPRLDERSHGVVLPPDFPAACANVIRECLSRRPGDRPTVATLQAWINRANGRTAPLDTPVPSERADFAPEPSAASARVFDSGEPPARLTPRAVVERETPAPKPVGGRPFRALAAAVVAIAAAGWGLLRLFAGHPPEAGGSKNPAQSTEMPSGPAPTSQRAADSENARAPSSAAATSPSGPDTQHHPSTANEPQRSANNRHPGGAQHPAAASVIHQEIPNVPRSALATIHGHVRVTVRVSVDASGAVVGESLVDPGPSHYFARVASEAARKWRFNPRADNPSRQWLVHFEFSRTGTAAYASARS
jgi:TonB family protein